MRNFKNLIKALKKITFFPFLFAKWKKHIKLFIWCISLYVFFVQVSPDLVFSENHTRAEMTVNGRVRLTTGELIPEEGLNVVLLKLILNSEGQVTPVGPQGRVKTDSKGNF